MCMTVSRNFILCMPCVKCVTRHSDMQCGCLPVRGCVCVCVCARARACVVHACDFVNTQELTGSDQ
jgi:hypothetical protein